MKIAVASGKGGTGKTTVATNLAQVASRDNRYKVGYLDCDVEEPNGAIFLKPQINRKRLVNVSIPRVDPDQCDGCGMCGRICQYSAIVVIKKKVLVFPELCHGCGGCWLVCPTGAIRESRRRVGRVEIGQADKISFVQGVLKIGEVMSPPVIRAAREMSPEVDLLFIDAPPGTSCPVIESIRDTDFVLLVTEPTPFGLYDLKLSVERTRALHLPLGVVINRSGGDDRETRAYCGNMGIDILAAIPDDRRIAEAYSRGRMIWEAIPEYQGEFASLLKEIIACIYRRKRVGSEA